MLSRGSLISSDASTTCGSIFFTFLCLAEIGCLSFELVGAKGSDLTGDMIKARWRAEFLTRGQFWKAEIDTLTSHKFSFEQPL